MKVKELVELLAEIDGEQEIYLSRDEEGNGFRPLMDVESAIISIDDGEIGVYTPTWSASSAGMSSMEWKAFKRDNPRGVVLWP